MTNKTVNHYLDVLTSAFVIHSLQPWHENVKKRQVKAPKVYFFYTGLLPFTVAFAFTKRPRSLSHESVLLGKVS